ncbi:hypothetical protein [Aquimarina sp. SS2-1]|uniref:hypothetical protein n=1 Tax=Aquimarina besae TaxID=3342247 RepID=UPI00366BA55F
MLSQEVYQSGTIDFGLGAVISVGLQEEVGFDIRFQFISSPRKTSYIVAYHRFLSKNSKMLDCIMISVFK